MPHLALNSDFMALPIAHAPLLSRNGIRAYGVLDGVAHLEGGTFFGCITAGSCILQQHGLHFPLSPGMFFVAREAVQLQGGQALILQIQEYHGLFQIGGPIEATGRLRYIDGCSDTLLVCPPRLGEPCLNHLHIPAGTLQSPHTHPSDRWGVIAAGSGHCRTQTGRHALSAGLAWWIPAGVEHSFVTDAESLDVFALHPDSDFGPQDGDHPMVNRTVLQSLKKHEA